MKFRVQVKDLGLWKSFVEYFLCLTRGYKVLGALLLQLTDRWALQVVESLTYAFHTPWFLIYPVTSAVDELLSPGCWPAGEVTEMQRQSLIIRELTSVHISWSLLCYQEATSCSILRISSIARERIYQFNLSCI